MGQLTELEVFAIRFSLLVAITSMLLIVPFAILISHLLVRHKFPGKVILEAVIHIPLVLPPVVTGFLLLTVMSSNTLIGKCFYAVFGSDIAFAFPGCVIAAAVVSFPLVVRPIIISMKDINPDLLNVSRSLGSGRTATFFRIILPLSLPGIIGGTVIGFARSLGEFGATIMLAGNIPFKTTTIPLAIFSFFNRTDGYQAMVRLVVISIIIAFLSLGISEYLASR